MTRAFRRTLIFCSLLLAIGSVQAEVPGLEFDYPLVADRWGVGIGGFAADLDTTVSVGIGDLLGTTINLENVLGLETSQKTLAVEGFYRIKAKHGLQFSWVELNRSSDLAITEQFEYDGILYAAGVQLQTTFDMTLLKILYRYSFINNGKIDTGLQTGLSFFGFDTSISGRGTELDDQGMPVGPVAATEAQATIIAPVPSLGFYIDFAAYKWMIVRFSADYLDLSFGDLEGSYQTTGITLEFRPQQNFGIGIGLASTDIKASNRGEDPWSVNYNYDGVTAYLATSF